MDTEKEDILVAIYINLINMVNALTGHLPTFKQTYLFYRKLFRVKKYTKYFAFANDFVGKYKYEFAKRKPVVGYDSRRGQTCNFIKKEALAQVLSCEFREILNNIFFTEHLWTTASMTPKYEILIVRSSHQRCSTKKVFLKILQNSQGSTCVSLFLIKFQASASSTSKKEILAKVFSREFCKIFNTTFFREHLWRTTSLQ